MDSRSPKYVPFVLLLVVLTVACSDSTPADVTGPTTAAQPVSLMAEPAKVVPELLPPIGVCEAPRFRTRFVVILGGTGFLQRMEVSFIDRFGVNTVPTLVTSTRVFPGSTLNTPTPVSLPSSMPIPIPLGGPNNGLSVPTGGLERFPLELEFGCNVRPRGTIVVLVDTRDDRGRSKRSRLSVPVGE